MNWGLWKSQPKFNLINSLNNLMKQDDLLIGLQQMVYLPSGPFQNSRMMCTICWMTLWKSNNDYFNTTVKNRCWVFYELSEFSRYIISCCCFNSLINIINICFIINNYTILINQYCCRYFFINFSPGPATYLPPAAMITNFVNCTNDLVISPFCNRYIVL